VSFCAELYKCKAVLLADDKTTVYGYYNCTCSGHFIDGYKINPYTLCRNTGIKLKARYLYEGDLIEYKNALSDWRMGFIAWDDFNKCFVIQSSINFSSKQNIRLFDIRIIGNITLNDADLLKMQAYSDKEEKNYRPEPIVECRSTQYLNKKAKRFLPR